MTTSKQVKDWLQLTIDRRAGRTSPQQEAEEACALQAIDIVSRYETLTHRLSKIWTPHKTPPTVSIDPLLYDEALIKVAKLQHDYPHEMEEDR